MIDGRLKGRVLDILMLDSLNSGCPTIGHHSNEAAYTLDRAFSVHHKKLKDSCLLIVGSSDGINIIPDRRMNVEKLFH